MKTFDQETEGAQSSEMVEQSDAASVTTMAFSDDGQYFAYGRADRAVVLAKSPVPYVAPISQPDCLFNWAERTYPQYFVPAGTASATATPYYYRYYTGTKHYLATSSADIHVLVLGPSFGIAPLDVGPIAGFLSMAGCSP